MTGDVVYLYEDSLREAANQRGENCWFRYAAEVLDELGVTAEAAPLAALSRPPGCRVLALGDYDAALLPAEAEASLSEWVDGGGVLVGFGTTGLDRVFGVASAGPDIEAEPFTVGGWMSLDGRDEAAGLLDERLPKTDCPILSPLRRIAAADAVALTHFVDDGAPASPAITRREIGRGRAYYFAFNLPQAVWTYHQGRPVTEDLDGTGYLRTGDAIIVRDDPAMSVPCADLMLLILENMLAGAGVPFVHHLPPSPAGVPDALFHYGGDDEAKDGLQAEMSRLMRELGLPYHVNVMLGGDGAFHFTDEDRALYEANGHEFSLHFNFMDYPEGVAHPAPIDEAEYARQVDLFEARYGRTPICVNTHCCRASGWADAARLGARRGIRGENTAVHRVSPPADPVNRFGAAFGTVYPHFVYDDAAHGNKRLDFVSIPIGFYEPGAYGWEESHPYHDQDPFRPDEYRRVADLACHYGWTLNIFLHPTHMAHPRSRGRDALRCILDHLDERKADVLHVGTDALCLWWRDRSRTRVERDGGSTYVVDTPHAGGVLIRFSRDTLAAGACFELDGEPVTPVEKGRLGRPWCYVVVPRGRHTLHILGEDD